MPTVAPVTLDSPRVKQLSDQNTSGTQLGASSTDLVGMFGATPVAQPSGNAQAAVTRGQACGSVITFTLNQSGTSVQAGTTSEFTMILLGNTAAAPVLATDLLFINKPSSQAGLGVGNVRGSGNNTLGVTFANLTGTTIVPTATETWRAVALRGFNPVTLTASPAAVAANSITEQLFTVTGVRVGDLIQVNKPTQQAGLDIVGCRAAANNQVGITFMNDTSVAITPTAAEAYTVYSLGGLDAVNNEILFQITASPTSVPGVVTTEYAMPVTNLLIGDVVKGVSKPSFQSGLGIAGYRVSVPSTLGVTFMNNLNTTVQPTAGEVYEIAITRPNPVAPLLLYTQALTPTAVPGNTTAEQTFTVTGLIASTPVWVNKPSAQANLGIAGVRVSAANTLAINFCNSQATSITPTAAETYIIGNFQDLGQTGGVFTTGGTAGAGGGGSNAMHKTAAGVTQQSAILANAERTALVNLGAISGA